MKRFTITLLFFLLVHINLFSQELYHIDNGDIVISKIIDNTGLSKETAHDLLSVEVQNIWDAPFDELMLNNERCIVYKGKRILTTVLPGYYNDYLEDIKIQAEFVLSIDFKDNRTRITIRSTNAYITTENSNDNIAFKITDKSFYLDERFKKYGIKEKKATETFNALIEHMNSVISHLEECLRKNQGYDEW